MGGDRGNFRPTKKPTDPLHADRRNFYKVDCTMNGVVSRPGQRWLSSSGLTLIADADCKARFSG